MGKTSLKRTPTKTRHEQARLAVVDALKPFEADGMSVEELVATLAILIGQFSIFFDGQEWTPEQVVELVKINIAEGNRNAVANTFGGHPAGNA
ncbi:MAG: hypothetical protein AAF739_16930 [Pseudomonadota bacterium]